MTKTTTAKATKATKRSVERNRELANEIVSRLRHHPPSLEVVVGAISLLSGEHELPPRSIHLD